MPPPLKYAIINETGTFEIETETRSFETKTETEITTLETETGLETTMIVKLLRDRDIHTASNLRNKLVTFQKHQIFKKGISHLTYFCWVSLSNRTERIFF